MTFRETRDKQLNELKVVREDIRHGLPLDAQTQEHLIEILISLVNKAYEEEIRIEDQVKSEELFKKQEQKLKNTTMEELIDDLELDKQ